MQEERVLWWFCAACSLLLKFPEQLSVSGIENGRGNILMAQH